MKIPKQIEEISSDCAHLGGLLVYLGHDKGQDVYTYEYPKDMTIGIPDVYLWDGKLAKKVTGEQALEISLRFS